MALIFAVDPGRSFGWASIEGKNINASNVLPLADDIGLAVGQIGNLMDSVGAAADAIWCESRPFQASSGRSAEWAGAIRGAVAAWGARHRVPYSEVYPQTWKKAVCGAGDLTPAEYTAVISRLLGGRSLQQDEAAAIGVGLYGVAWEAKWRRCDGYRCEKGRHKTLYDSVELAVAAHKGAFPVLVGGYVGDRRVLERKVWG